MKKLSELNDNTALFCLRTDELVSVGSVRGYIGCGEENMGEYHTVKFLNNGILSLGEEVDIQS